MYKTYSYTYGYDEIQKILERKGYIIKTISKIIDLSPELRDKKKEIFRSRDRYGNITTKTPSAFKVKLAFKPEELSDVIKSVELLEKHYNESPFFHTTLCKCDTWGKKGGISRYFMENVLGDIFIQYINLAVQ